MKIVLIGSGNIATALGMGFKQKGIKVIQVYSRTAEHAKNLANKLNCKHTHTLNNVDPTANLHLICTSDTAIHQVVNNLTFTPELIAHTSGNTHLDSLAKFDNYGVFYPVQSFTKERDIDLSQVPICIEASNKKSVDTLQNMAALISNQVLELSSEKRKKVHLSAVFANNFSNHMANIAMHILATNNIDPKLLNPLIAETANKLQIMSPQKAQTGPALRNDKQTIDDHLELLADEDLEKLYSFVTQSIFKYKNKAK